jgi:tight adherence protein B
MPTQVLAAAILIFLGMTSLAGALAVSRRKRMERERRVGLVSKRTEDKPGAGPEGSRLAVRARKIDLWVKKVLTFGAGYSWGMHASAPLLLIVAFVSAVLAWYIFGRALGLPVLLTAALCAGAGCLGPRFLLRRQQDRAEREFTNLFPDALDMVIRMLRGGMPITYAIRIAGEEAPPPVNAVFATIAAQMNIGVPIADALDTGSRRIALPDFRFFAVTAIIQYATGGNLISTLEELSQIMRKRLAVRLKARAVSAEVRFSAYVLGALPLVVVMALLAIEPDYLAPLFEDRRGHVILAMAGGGLMLSFLSMRHMMRSLNRDE